MILTVGIVIAELIDLDDDDGDSNDDGDAFDNGAVGSNITNDAKCGYVKMKVDCIEVTACVDGSSNVDGGHSDDDFGDTNDEDTNSGNRDGKSNDGADRHKNNDNFNDGECLFSVKNCFTKK